MLGTPKSVAWVVGMALVACLLAAPVTAADEGHVEDVETLEAELDDIVQKYRGGENVSADLKTFIQEDWEDVEYHEAVETTDVKAYGAIWTEINALRNAVESDAPPREVDARAEDVKTALRRGLDALEGGTQEEHSGHAHTSTKEGDGAEETVDRIRADLDRSVRLYADGEVDEATAVVSETYLSNFEGLEGDLIEKDPDLVTDLEIDFNAELPGLMSDGAPVEDVEARVDEMNGKLDRVEALLSRDGGDADVFGTDETRGSDGGGMSAPGPGVLGGVAALVAALLARRTR